MQHVINLHVHVGKNLQEDDESKKTSDMAPDVEDKGGDYNSQASHPMQEMVQSAAQPVMSPSDHENDDRISILENIGADASHKNPKSLRGKAMYAAGQEMNRLKAKKKKS